MGCFVMSSEQHGLSGTGTIMVKWIVLLVALVFTSTLFMSWFNDGLASYTRNVVTDMIAQVRTGL